MAEIKRYEPKRTQNSVSPAKPVHYSSLNSEPTTGIQSLHETIKLLSQAPFSRIVDNATVLELWPPNGNLKSKYTLPHLNMKDGKFFEGYLLKIRDPIHDEGSRVNPEEYLIELQNLDPNAKPSSFFGNNIEKPEQKIAIKNYYDACSTHKTFAPKTFDGIFSSPPAPGTKVRIHYFQEPHISAGHNIAGLYEKMHDDDVFEEGLDNLRAILQKFRQLYLNAVAAAENIIEVISSNLPNINSVSQTDNTGQSIAPGPGSSQIRQNLAAKNEEQKYDYFANFVPQNGGTFKTNPGEKNIIGLRKSTKTTDNEGKGVYDDIFYLAWKDKSGKKRVGEYVGNTEPNAYYLDKRNTQGTALQDLQHLSRLRPGFMIYTVVITQERNNDGGLKYGGRYLRMKSGTYGVTEKDLNDDGLFNDNSINNRGGTSMLFHAGGPTTPYSAGCQTMSKDIFNRFMNDVLSEGDPGDLGYTLADEATLYDPEATQSLAVQQPEPETGVSTEIETNPQESTSEEISLVP